MNIKDHNGSTPLHIAVNYNRIEITEFLNSHGSNIYVSNNESKTPFSCAALGE